MSTSPSTETSPCSSDSSSIVLTMETIIRFLREEPKLIHHRQGFLDLCCFMKVKLMMEMSQTQRIVSLFPISFPFLPVPETAPTSPCSRQTSLPSTTPVMSASLLNNGVAVSAISTDTSEATMAVLRFNVSTISRPLHGSFRVTWWDTGRRKWADDRQCEIISDSGGIIEAKCLHLTDFAIIVVSPVFPQHSEHLEFFQDAALNDPNVCDDALITLGYIVNGLSILSLAFLTFFSISA